MATDTRDPQQARELARGAQEQAEAARGTATFRGLAWLAGSLAADADRLAPQPADWRPITELRVGDLVVYTSSPGGGRGKVAPVADVWREGAETTGRWFVTLGSATDGTVRRTMYPKGVRRTAKILIVR